MGIYDYLNNAVVALVPSWRASNCRWCGVHTAFAFAGVDDMGFVPYNLGGLDTRVTDRWPRWLGLVPIVWRPPRQLNAGGDIGDCDTMLGLIGQPNPPSRNGEPVFHRDGG